MTTTYRLALQSLMLVVILFLFTASGFAQAGLATLRGKAIDQQGGVLPGATVTVRHVETNTTRTSVTEATGQYFLPSLPAGTYELTVELSGFTTAKRTDVVLRVGQEAEIDVVLGVGTVQENVTVAGQAALVETQHVIGAFIDTARVENLPTVSRNFADLAQLAPGVSSTGGSSMGFSVSPSLRTNCSILPASKASTTARRRACRFPITGGTRVSRRSFRPATPEGRTSEKPTGTSTPVTGSPYGTIAPSSRIPIAAA